MRAFLVDADARRRQIADERRIDAYRVLNGPAEGAPPGLTVDRYASWLVVAAREELGDETSEAWASSAFEALRPEGVVLKTLCRPVARSRSLVFVGDLPSAPVKVREGDAAFLCDLDDGPSTGLFLDHRETRFAIRAYAQSVDVLNLFAYTGAFSVHAALGGAKRVTSVDVAKRSLARARENMRASGLDPDRHRWFADDVLEHVKRQARRGAAYGLVIVDPPVLGRSRKVTFSLEHDLDALVEGCMGCVRPGGVLVLSTHAVAYDDARLRQAVEAAAARQGRVANVLAILGLPSWDHPVVGRAEESALDRGDYLKTLVLSVG